MRLICLVALALTLTLAAVAQAWRPSDLRKHATSFFAGVAVGIGVHELGHITVASANGYGVRITQMSITYTGDPMTSKTHLEIASAGIQAQWLLSEGLLREHEAHPAKAMPSFQAGMVMSHILISAAYLTVLRNNPYGDLRGISDSTGVSTQQLALWLAVPAALDYWRLTARHVPAWVPQLSLGIKCVGIAKVWTF